MGNLKLVNKSYVDSKTGKIVTYGGYVTNTLLNSAVVPMPYFLNYEFNVYWGHPYSGKLRCDSIMVQQYEAFPEDWAGYYLGVTLNAISGSQFAKKDLYLVSTNPLTSELTHNIEFDVGNIVEIQDPGFFTPETGWTGWLDSRKATPSSTPYLFNKEIIDGEEIFIPVKKVNPLSYIAMNPILNDLSLSFKDIGRGSPQNIEVRSTLYRNCPVICVFKITTEKINDEETNEEDGITLASEQYTHDKFNIGGGSPDNLVTKEYVDSLSPAPEEWPPGCLPYQPDLIIE